MTELLEKLGIRSRHGVERFIEDLIAMLDDMDPDPDLEDDELEAVNEDGGDICDEPHDAEGDDEASMGWAENDSQWQAGLGAIV